VWPMLAPATMHQCCLPGSYHPPERTSPTTCAGVGPHARVRQSTAAKKEGGSLVRGTEESDRIAALASAETQVCARAVLPGSGSSEHEATAALPQSADSTGSAGHHLVEPRQENRPQHARRSKGVPLREFFNTHACYRQLIRSPFPLMKEKGRPHIGCTAYRQNVTPSLDYRPYELRLDL
jgi:hypothetical protein